MSSRVNRELRVCNPAHGRRGRDGCRWIARSVAAADMSALRLTIVSACDLISECFGLVALDGYSFHLS
jgi:hypothetical protein